MREKKEGGRTGTVVRIKEGKGVRVHFDGPAGAKVDKAWLTSWEDPVVVVPSSSSGRAAPRRGTKRARDNSNGPCAHCGAAGHGARECAFGLNPRDRFLLCNRVGQDLLPCFSRHFLVLCRRAVPEFDVSNLRDGRLDVATGAVSAALFRSQSLRKNVHVQCVLAGPSATKSPVDGDSAVDRSISVFGALVRDLRPDDRSLAERLRLVAPRSADAQAKEAMSSATQWSVSPFRGVEGSDCSFADALERSIQGSPPATVFLLAGGASTGGAEAVGESVEAIAAKLKGDPQRLGRLRSRGLVCILGDDRGLTPAHEALVQRVCDQHGADLHCVSLGPDVLFTSHCIVLLNHELDRHLHRCAVPPPRRLEGK